VNEAALGASSNKEPDMPSYLTPEHALNAVTQDIRTHFAGVSLVFYNDYLKDGIGVEVHLRTRSRLKEVKEYCKWLMKDPPDGVPVKIRVT